MSDYSNDSDDGRFVYHSAMGSRSSRGSKKSNSSRRKSSGSSSSSVTIIGDSQSRRKSSGSSSSSVTIIGDSQSRRKSSGSSSSSVTIIRDSRSQPAGTQGSLEDFTSESVEVVFDSQKRVQENIFAVPTETPKRASGRRRKTQFKSGDEHPRRSGSSASDRSTLKTPASRGSSSRTPMAAPQTSVYTPPSSGRLSQEERELSTTPSRRTRQSGVSADSSFEFPSTSQTTPSQRSAWDYVYKKKTRSSPSGSESKSPSMTGMERYRKHMDRILDANDIQLQIAILESLLGSVEEGLDEENRLMIEEYQKRQLDNGESIRAKLEDFVKAMKASVGNDDAIKKVHDDAENYLKGLLKKVLLGEINFGKEDKNFGTLAGPLFDAMCTDTTMLHQSLMEKFNRAVDSVEFMKELLKLCLDEFGKLKKNVSKQLYKKIIGCEMRTHGENALRTLGRMNYHVRKPEELIGNTYADGTRMFYPMTDLYPQMRVEFLESHVKRVHEVLPDFPDSQDNENTSSYGQHTEESSDDDEDFGPDHYSLYTYHEPTADEVRLRDGERIQTDSEEEEAEEEDEDEEKEAEVGILDEMEVEKRRDDERAPLDTHEGLAMSRELRRIYGEDVMDELVDPVSREMAKRITYMRRCSTLCKVPDNDCAAQVLECLREFVRHKEIGNKMDLALKDIEEKQCLTDEGTVYSVKEWLKRYEDCYAGMRSLVRRLTDMRTLITFILNMRQILDRKGSIPFNYDLFREVLKLEGLPKRIKLQFLYFYRGKIDDLHHREKYVKKRYAAYLKSFEENSNEHEINTCQVCWGLHVAKDIKLFLVPSADSPPPTQLAPYIDRSLPQRPMYGDRDDLERRNKLKSIFDEDEEDEEKAAEEEEASEGADIANMPRSYGVCLICWRQIRNQQMPKAAVKNGLVIPQQPRELRGLNWIEQMLIQLIRPLHSIVCLRDISGKKTPVRATKGGMVMVPVDIEATVSRVADTLPSTSKLMIEVRTSFGDKRIVNLPKVLEALAYLKAHHRLYSDVQIDEQFKFTPGEDVFFEKADINDEDVEALIERRANQQHAGHLLTQDDFAVRPMQDINPPYIDLTTTADKYRLLGHQYKPLSIDEPDADVMAFPGLHPSGRFGWNEQRQAAIQMTEYIKARLRQADRRFATDKNWVMFCYQYLLQKELTSTLGIQARIGNQTSAGDIKRKIEIEDEEFFKANMTSIFAKMRGFPPYWHQIKLKLRSHVAAFGPPNLFMTLNPNERQWKEVQEIYKRLKPENASRINPKTIRRFIADDPQPFSRFFYRRVRTFFNKFLKAGQGDANAPLGDIVHWFYRMEWQTRGTPHVHCLLWTADAPRRDASQEEIIGYIDKRLTCRLPGKKEPRLRFLVKTYQMHWKLHNKTCMRKRLFGKNWKTYCRFDMPRPVLGRTVLTTMDRNIRGLLGTRKRPYYLARRRTETMINDYNAAVLLGWGANIDIQAIIPTPGNDNETLMGYCSAYSAYTTKASTDGVFGEFDKPDKQKKTTEDEDEERKDLDRLFDDLEEQDENNAEKKSLTNPDFIGLPGTTQGDGTTQKKNTNLQAMWKSCLKMMNAREAGLYEIMDHLMGHKLIEFDSDHIWVNLDEIEKRSRMLIPKAQADKGSGKGYQPNFMDDYYPNRPDELEDHSVFNINMNFEIAKEDRIKGKKIFSQRDNDNDDTGSQADFSQFEEDPVSDDDAIDDDADLRIMEKNKKRQRKGSKSPTPRSSSQGSSASQGSMRSSSQRNRRPIETNQTRNVFDDIYNTKDKRSPFYKHPNITVGTGLQLIQTDRTRGKMFRKKKARAIRFLIPQLDFDDDDKVEDYFRRLCILFIPWRDEARILEENQTDSYVKLFDKFFGPESDKGSKEGREDVRTYLDRCVKMREEDRKRAAEYLLRQEALRKEVDKDAIESEDSEADGAPRRPIHLTRDTAQKIQSNDEQVERYPRIVNLAEFHNNYKNLKKNQKQMEIFEMVTKHVAKQEEQKEKKLPVDSPLLLFVSGTAGTGKSFLIKMVADQLTIDYVKTDAARESGLSPAVLICAPTGNAAHGVKGVTIHKLIGAKLFEDVVKDMMIISSERCQKKRAIFANAKVLIIDEISMCANMLLYQVNMYLQYIRGTQELFGGLNVILLGDLLQLPPVKAQQVFERPKKRDIQKLLGGMPVSNYTNRFDLWRMFSYKELVTNHRQGKDKAWGEILGFGFRLKTSFL